MKVLRGIRVRYAVYETATGRILRRIETSAADTLEEDLAAGEEALLTEVEFDDSTHYIDLTGAAPAIAVCETMAPVVSIREGAVDVAGLPNPCTVIWHEQEQLIEGGEASIEFDEPGAHVLTFRAPPRYLDHVLEVEVP